MENKIEKQKQINKKLRIEIAKFKIIRALLACESLRINETKEKLQKK